MSTRSLIGKQNSDGSVKFIYCHHDGYLSGVGKTLVDFYDENNIEQLFDLGDLSALGNNPVSNKNAWKSLNWSDEMCVAYKDRGEDCPATTVSSVEEFLKEDAWQEFWYLLKDGKWYFTEDKDEEFKLVEENL